MEKPKTGERIITAQEAKRRLHQDELNQFLDKMGRLKWNNAQPLERIEWRMRFMMTSSPGEYPNEETIRYFITNPKERNPKHANNRSFALSKIGEMRLLMKAWKDGEPDTFTAQDNMDLEYMNSKENYPYIPGQDD